MTDDITRSIAKQWSSAAREGHSPHMQRRLVTTPGVRYDVDGVALVPMVTQVDGALQLVGLLRIFPNEGEELQPPEVRQGAYCPIGKIGDDDKVLSIAIGYAAARSVSMASDGKVGGYVAFSADNLLHVARMARLHHPNKHILFFTDDDAQVEQRMVDQLRAQFKLGGPIAVGAGECEYATDDGVRYRVNVGWGKDQYGIDHLTAAVVTGPLGQRSVEIIRVENLGRVRAAAAAIEVGNASVAWPRFSDRGANAWRSFNDLHVEESFDAVRAQVQGVLVAALHPGGTQQDRLDHEIPSPSRVSDAPAQASRGVESASSERAAGAGRLILPGDDADIYAWHDLLIRKPQNNRLEDCRENIYTILVNDPALSGMIALDEFSMMQVKCTPAPWSGQIGEWTEEDDFSLGMFMAQQHGLVIKSDSAIEKAVAQAARMNRFNPVVNYLDSLEWDGVARLETWLAAVAGAIQSPYCGLIGTLFLMSMVARAYRPGCQMDYAPVFEGGQGARKSSLLRVLGGEWYKETPFKVGEKDGYLSIQGAWLYEIAELDSFNKGDITTIKAFITNKVDDFRAPYGRRNAKYPRRTCFAATTNQDEYLKDTTGARRFWPVQCGLVNLELLQEIRDQLFAEAVVLFKAGLQWHPTPEDERDLIRPEQEQREIEDVWYPRIYRFLEGISDSSERIPTPRLTEVTMEILLTKALQIEIGKLSAAKSESTRVGNCMKRLGWLKAKRGTGARESYYVRPIVPKTAKDDDVPT